MAFASCKGCAIILGGPDCTYTYMYIVLCLTEGLRCIAQGEKELQVSLFQALVLMLFNTSDKLSFTHIREVTRIGKAN